MANSSVVTIRVGAIIAAGLAIICFAIFSIGHGTRMLKRTDIIETHFHRINGLQSGAPVSLAGVNIGAVQSIGFPDDPHADYVVVKLWIVDTDLPRVRSDSVAQIDTMGLLGDKYIEISGGNPQSPSLAPGDVLAAQDPFDLQALLQKPGIDKMMDNMVDITQSLQSILASIDKGHGILAELVKGGGGDDKHPPLTLADLRMTFDNMNKLAMQMNIMLDKVNHGRGLAGAMMSDQTDGKKLLDEVQQAAATMRDTAQKVTVLVDKFNRGNGAVQRLLSDQQYANQLLANMQTSLADMKDILRKIDAGQGSVGLAVNDPTLYYDAKNFLGGNGSIGWGVRMLNGFYSLTHPFNRPQSTQSIATTPMNGADPPAAQSNASPTP
ncbi:MAG TPA: MlaD family protein [Candidatus Binataceae bacterium]|nr:MlaD family protein [Candidatus Binataceae bacterium]